MLDQPIVRRRVLAELRRLLKRPAMLKRWQRRARQFFPEISMSIEQAGGCNMLKYLPLLESGLRARAASGAGAKGWWQFIASTAKELSLNRYKNWDERYALERSTKAAITYLRQLYRRFGSWPLALAAYNTGMGRLQRAQAAQQQSQYWMLSLPEEAERYVPKLFAIIVALQHPHLVGLPLFDLEKVQESRVGRLTLRIPKQRRESLNTIAEHIKIKRERFAALNPQTREGQRLPTGVTLTFYIPREQLEVSAQRLRQARLLIPTDREIAGYQVRASESLWSIATESGLRVAELKRWNQIKDRFILRVGQRIRLRPPAKRRARSAS